MPSSIITKHFLLEHNMKFNWRIVVGTIVGLYWMSKEY